ncbi:MAG: type II secretion system protein [Gammaproteobacteria bacterium]|nr:type II secretion system protein [Rhodocyclaceae bacterium]MBU3910323.1 type II secretion system protein [Gammaproteobacteria bacterium]MBU3990253.1 type II secretion system protein [Gammaproteobacteria bacterium]MBU4004150.1 type II secretion system protein [Gammaproteobacteria bacterium]MBU4020397.1 type II secretion system protein [Gammaproteobacteria bacterium]
MAIISLGATASLGSGVVIQQRLAEAELLAIGLEYRQALQSYSDATPQGQATAPRELAELLRDPRYPGVRRHLRRIYPDPLTGTPEWGIVRFPDGRISGVHSLKKSPTIRRVAFPAGLEGFAKAEQYDEWVFALMPEQPAATPQFPPLFPN